MIEPRHEGLSSNWLKDELSSIFGATIQGLWLGEDLPYDASGNVTSWPGRIGPTLTNRTANLFTRNQTNGRLGIFTPANLAMALASNASGTGKSFWIASDGYTLTPNNAVVVMAYNNSNKLPIYVNSLQTIWTSSGETHAVDGVLSETFPTSGPVIVEGYYTGTGADHIEVGGYFSNPQAFMRTLPVVLQLSAIPTSIQRVKGVIALKRYRGTPMLAQEILARDLIEVLGANLASLYIMDDAVLSGSTPTALRSRMVGKNNLTVSGAAFASRLVNGRRCIYAPDTNQDRQFSGFSALSTLIHSVLCVAAIPASFSGFNCLYKGAGGGLNNTCVGYPLTTSWYTGTAYPLPDTLRHYIDSQVETLSAVTTPGLHLIGAYYNGVPTLDAASLGGTPDGTGQRSWNADIGLCAQLLTPVTSLSASTFASVLELCKRYYGF
jgi:hypothetical protein